MRYGVAGVAVSLGYTVTIVTLVDGLGLTGPETANGISLILWTALAYIVHHEFTFRFDGGYGGSLMKFAFVFVAKMVASLAIIAAVTQFYQGSYLIGVALNWVALPLASYLAMRLWVFDTGEPALAKSAGSSAGEETLKAAHRDRTHLLQSKGSAGKDEADIPPARSHSLTGCLLPVEPIQEEGITLNGLVGSDGPA